MTPIERACIAIIDNLRAQGDLMDDCGDPEWAQVDSSFRVEPLVRAVLAAMREPSEGMKSEGQQATRDPSGNMAESSGCAPWQVDAAWQAMIDAAMAEGV